MMLCINDDYCINENMVIDVFAKNIYNRTYEPTSGIARRDIVFRLLTGNDINVEEISCNDSHNTTVAGYIKSARERFAESKAGENK